MFLTFYSIIMIKQIFNKINIMFFTTILRSIHKRSRDKLFIYCSMVRNAGLRLWIFAVEEQDASL